MRTPALEPFPDPHSGASPAQIGIVAGSTLDFAFDQNYWIDAVGGSALALDLGTNELGNITSLADVTPANARSFEYDTLSRLTDVDDCNAALIEAFSYDATGNRLSKQTTSGTQSYGYAAGNHRLASIDATARGYDAMGSLTSRGDGWTFEFDARQRLSVARLNGTIKQNNTYNGKGERVGAGRGAGFLRKDYTYLYDEAGRLLAEYRWIPFQNLPPVLEREYVWLGDRPVAILVHDGGYAGEILHVHSDHLGTPRAVTRPDAGNAVVWRWDLRGTAFGEHAAVEDPDGDSVVFSLNLRYPGQYFDAESGLYYNYFRDYEAGTGRYLESDPIGLKGGINTYSYVAGQPLSRQDRLGLASCGGCDKNDPEVRAMINACEWQMCMYQGAAREGADIVHGQKCELICTAGVMVGVGLATRSAWAAIGSAIPGYVACNLGCSLYDATQIPNMGASMSQCSKRCEDSCGITW